MTVVATVLIPTFNHGPTLRHSVGSVLEQTVSDIEIFIVGDGVPDVTREIVDDLTSQDERVRFFDNPKGPRTGEIHRHQALAEARGEIVCYLSDDDLWLPDHVETMRELLDEADYANALMLHLDATGRLGVAPLDLSYPGERELVVLGRKGTSLSSMTHTLEMYRRLPYGWRTTPGLIYTDYYMQHSRSGGGDSGTPQSASDLFTRSWMCWCARRSRCDTASRIRSVGDYTICFRVYPWSGPGSDLLRVRERFNQVTQRRKRRVTLRDERRDVGPVYFQLRIGPATTKFIPLVPVFGDCIKMSGGLMEIETMRNTGRDS